jgi:iron complex outermembrane receptor protein
MRSLLLATVAVSALVLPAMAQNVPTEQVVVYGTLSSSGMGLAADKVPGTLQSLSADTVTAGHGATVLDSLGDRAAGVSLSDTQGNSMFQDLRFHGFEASPLQGTPQGVAVYQNGVRLNEAFGDTVNWDAIPQTAIARMDLWSNNPVFGLNALGGAVNMVMKNGFTFQGNDVSLQGGSYAHGQAAGEYGMQDGNFAFYGAIEGVTDGGWRLHSASNLGRVYADVGWRFGDSEIHIVASGSQSGLGVVGPTPIQLTQRNSASVYTWPQTTQNRVGSLAINGTTTLADHWQLAGTAYIRSLRQRHVDGNDGDFESCSTRSSYGGDLCLQDDAFGTPAGGKTTAFRNQFVIMNTAGQVFPYVSSDEYGTIDRTFTDTTTKGATLQLTSNGKLGGVDNYFTIGGSIDQSSIGFRSTSTLANEYPNFELVVDSSAPGMGSIIHTLGNLGYAPVNLGANTTYYGAYAVDAVDLTDALTVTAGLRLNTASINTWDRSGLASELNGKHGYSRINPLGGLTYKIIDGLSAFVGYSEANRVPTPLELDCASQTQPCLLEGSLVADPALKQVVSATSEAGFRGKLQGLSWSASVFRTNSSNDIVALASVIQGRGYYTNVPNTRRQGADISAQYDGDGWSSHIAYSYLDATYRFTGTIASANNPSADANGNVTVTPGRHIPLNPANQLRVGGDATVLDGFTVGADLVFDGSQYYDGDNANQNAKLPGYVTLNLRAAYTFMPNWQVFGVVNNVLNRHDALYGTYFSASDVSTTPALTDNRTITLEQPISFQLGLKTSF